MISKSKSISELYEEVKDFDLVITNDAPLATALNKMIDYPRLGYLAMTPRQLASRFAELNYDKVFERYEIVLGITQRTGKLLKLIHQMLDKVFDVWNHCGKLENTELYLSNEEKEILSYLKEYYCLEKAMDEFDEDFYLDKNIAVIGDELFTLLDLEVLPKRSHPAQKINLLKEEDFIIDKTYLFSSSKDLIEQTVSFIEKKFENEVAIVLNPDSEYLEIIKSRLKESGIKIQVKNYLSEDITTRNLLSILEFALRVDDLSVKELSALTGYLDFEIKNKYNQYNFQSYVKNICTDERIKSIYSLLKNVRDTSYSRFLRQLGYELKIDVTPELKKTIEKLKFSDELINDGNVITLKYFLQNFDVELESPKEGVLFVNALNSAFIDRQIIIFLGLDQSWTKLFPDKEYIDKVEEDKKALEKFQILLSQGQQRFYFTQNVSYNRELQPCYYFNILADKDIENFEADFFNPVFVNGFTDKNVYDGMKDILKLKDHEKCKTISPSSLNEFYKCPKKYSFSRLISGEDKPHFQRGKLLHNYAEMYFNHPEFTENSAKRVIDFMINKMSYLVKDLDKNSERTVFEIGINTLASFLKPLLSKRIKGKPSQPSDNELMKEFGKELLYKNTEQWFSDEGNTKLKGKIDLQFENTIVDYKTSSNRKKGSQIIANSNLESLEKNESDDFDFQSISYISARRKRETNGEVNFIYNFLLADQKSELDPSQTKEETVTRLKYVPYTFSDYIASENYFNTLKKEKPAPLLDKIEFENYRNAIIKVISSSIDFFDNNIVKRKVQEVFYDLVINKLCFTFKEFKKQKENTFNDHIIQPLSDSIYKLRIGNTEEAYIFKDDVEKFLTMVNEKITKINVYQKSYFPAEPVYNSRDVCKECEYLNICIDNKLWN